MLQPMQVAHVRRNLTVVCRITKMMKGQIDNRWVMRKCHGRCGSHTTYGHYEFLVISFCVTSDMETFMDLMNIVLQSYLDSFVIFFIENIFVY